jgi:hypothetical protein
MVLHVVHLLLDPFAVHLDKPVVLQMEYLSIVAIEGADVIGHSHVVILVAAVVKANVVQLEQYAVAKE